MLQHALFIALALLTLSEAADLNLSGEKFDYFLLAQSCPQTSCWDLTENWQNSGSSCTSCNKLSDSWTIHGLWTNRYNGNHPFNCDDETRFRPNSVNEALKHEMSLKWRTYKSGFTNQRFWSYEWKKHGTCAAEVPETNSIKKYVSKALNLLDTYNMKTLLQKANIQPGGSYEYNTVFNAFRNVLGVEGRLGCAKNPKNGEQYLFEAYICLDKSFRPINCVSYAGLPGCKHNKKVVYPIALKSCH
ncbi:hypothetical protein TSAR_005385 [Trichomalopsis sarcophagae]|uniref:Uncharacterized protein n=1 Tax=Trichomalopsis sarcophagae TaxID=543379 RepID=A0A232EXY4_9HYME|nr:hypothetical protein TSAR_005385 [Trichomalopsis sarcophagae]